VNDELMKLPSYYLEDKHVRVNLFETGLKHYCFAERTREKKEQIIPLRRNK